MSCRRTRWLATTGAVRLLALIAVYTPSIGQTSNACLITVRDFMFVPTPLTVKAGSTVTWTNKDDEPHNVVSDTAEFRSGGLDTDGHFSHRFDRPGTYHFTCSIHPRMVGSIVVQ